METQPTPAASRALQNPDPPPAKHSDPKMGPVSAAAVVTASMIGAGVYTTSGFTLSALGSPGWVMLAWGVGGLIAICGAVCYGALAQRFTESGGEYLFLARAVHPAAGMVAGWVSLLAGFTGAIAFAATTFESYARSFQWSWIDSVAQGAIAIVVVLLAAFVHSLGIHGGTRVQNTLVIVKLALIAAFLCVAFSTIGTWQGVPVQFDSATPMTDTPIGSPRSWAFVLIFANALTWISLSYSGFNAAVYMSGEIRSPERSVPRAMLWGTIAVTVIYLLLNAVFVYAPTKAEVIAPENIANIATVATDSIAKQIPGSGEIFAGWISPLIRITILAGLLTSVSALVQTGPFVYQKMSKDGLLPAWLVGSPTRSTWTQTVLAGVVILSSTLRQQLDYLGFTLSMSAALCASLVFFLRGNTRFDVRVPGYPVIPLVYVVGTLSIATLTAIRAPTQALVGLGTMITGVIAYVIMRPADKSVG